MEEKVMNLSNSELRNELLRHGESVGPVTEATRKLFERRLLRLSGNSSGDDITLDKEELTESSLSPDVKTTGVEQEGKPDLNASTYFGVYISPEECIGEIKREELPDVFRNKKEVLDVLKKHRNARFKSFSSEESAINFSKFGPHNEITSPVRDASYVKTSSVENLEKANNFKSLSPQELIKLRKAIERGDEEVYRQCVWSNPRYLIGNADNATILQEGSRYNALHVAVKAKQLTMCVLILDTIQDSKFVRMMYPDESNEAIIRRINFFVDCYLNTPDKGANETPLHFASKFGCLQIVERLTLHPSCERDKTNKYNQTPCQIVCDRVTDASNELKTKIVDRLKSCYYVPLLQSGDCLSPAIVGNPYSPTADSDIDKFEGPSIGNIVSPIAPNLQIRALAGPMPLKQAEPFSKKWKSSPKSRLEKIRSPLANVTLSDVEKGHARIGRNLSKEENVPWIEYWPFLDSFCDLTSEHGLNKLELHLEKQLSHQVELEPHSIESDDSNIFEEDASQHISLNSSGIGQLCRQFEDLNLASDTSSTSDLSRETPSASRFHDVIQKLDFETSDLESFSYEAEYISKISSEISKSISNLLPMLLIEDPDVLQEKIVTCFAKTCSYMKCYANKFKPQNLSGLHSSIAKDMLKNMSNSVPVNDLTLLNNTLEETRNSTDCIFTKTKPYLICVIKLLTFMLLEDELIKLDCSCVWKINSDEEWRNGSTSYEAVASDDSSDSSSEVFYTPPNSTVDSPRLLTPTEGPPVFIDGLKPSKSDMDVFRAIEEIEICQNVYPHIFYWKRQLDGYSRAEKQSWQTPVRKGPVGQQIDDAAVFSPIRSNILKSKQEILSPSFYDPIRTRLFNNS